MQEATRGTETSKYPEEEKEKIDFPSSGERTGKRPNLMFTSGVEDCQRMGHMSAEDDWKVPA